MALLIMDPALSASPTIGRRVESRFRAHPLLRNAHQQTIAPLLFRRMPVLDLRIERLETPDGDFVDLGWSGPEDATLHVLPTLWFRNTWSWGYARRRGEEGGRDEDNGHGHSGGQARRGEEDRQEGHEEGRADTEGEQEREGVHLLLLGTADSRCRGKLGVPGVRSARFCGMMEGNVR